MSIMGESVHLLMDSHANIWDFVQQYWQRYKETPTPEIVKERFPDFEYDPELGGVTHHHVEQLRSKRLEGELKAFNAKIQDALEQGSLPPKKVLEKMAKAVSRLQREAGVSVAVDVRDKDAALQHYQEVQAIAAQFDGRPGIQFGFKSLDDVYPTGLSAGHFGVILGYSGHGKSWFALKLLINAWKDGHPVMLINLEMSPEELRDRIYFLISHYSMTDLVQANINPDDFIAWADDFMAGKAEFTLVGNDSFGDFSVDMVQAKVEQYKPKLVLLDYLGLFTDREFSPNETVRMKNLSRQLKQLAMWAKIPVIAISAVTGKDKKDRLVAPEIAQVAWSSGIEYDANFAIAVHTNRNEKGEYSDTDVILRKNRHGPLAGFKVKMDLENGTIEEVEPEEQLRLLKGSDTLSFVGEDEES